MRKGQPSNLISSYRKRQQIGPFVAWGLALVLVLGGVIVLVMWLTSTNSPALALFATKTPTATVTLPPTNTLPPSETPTETGTPTQTLTPTPSAAFEYVVQEGESLATIAEKFNLGDDGIPLILLLNPYDEKTGQGIDPTTQIVFVGQKITVPPPGMQYPTSTPVPSNLARGTKVIYVIQTGDNLASIASQFNSTVEDIKKTNNIQDENKIFVGQQITVHVNLVTPTVTKIPTTTPIGGGPTVTPSPSATP
jgi:LysM repeat protein